MMEAFDPDGIGQAVFVVGERHEMLDEPWRAHRRATLIHVNDGVLTVRTEAGRWVVPPGRALWIAADTRHCLRAARPVELHVLYVAPDCAADRAPFSASEDASPFGFASASLSASLPARFSTSSPASLPTSTPWPAQTGALVPDALVQALLAVAAGLPHDVPLDEPARRLLHVLLDRLAVLPAAPLGLTWPRDPRAQRIADALSADPAQSLILEELAAAAGVTARTAARLFAKETGQTFGQWRQQLRLLAALEHLGAGESVTQVALAVGYSDVSSFIAVFREAFGDTPARYFR
ncbi:helix-turn-helix transcriptional regulator [Burkholderia sp. Ax-1724]|uniref:AraC family transcriptional regulator n=1 Tax=Burkholderia sp. Ax-1724 TaxID=2608336 RepID=UPI001422F48C|nr:helix-turn-helix transcriptional regulator [Burkholderia sp. Ax-1724]NIF52913.1 helix-turn-helix transcriptional regulator [Burkholderia sp. Ax-1724]